MSKIPLNKPTSYSNPSNPIYKERLWNRIKHQYFLAIETWFSFENSNYENEKSPATDISHLKNDISHLEAIFFI